jgi:hypothetical protein
VINVLADDVAFLSGLLASQLLWAKTYDDRRVSRFARPGWLGRFGCGDFALRKTQKKRLDCRSICGIFADIEI